MIATEGLSLSFGTRPLFENVDAKFTKGNCYGLIGANGAGKSTFLRCLSGELDSYSGKVVMPAGARLSVLKQDHFAYDAVPARTAVIMGHAKLHEVMVEKDALYAKPDFGDADGVRVADLEGLFTDMDGWNAETNASQLLSALGIPPADHDKLVGELDDSAKVRVLLAQALFGNPDVLLLDEPTNHLDVDSILWLEEFLLGFENTVIVVSHDRHFLDKVCTHVADLDFQKLTLFTGNYTFWYESSQLALRQRQSANKKKEDKIKELQAFIQRFSANASKSRQASSRRALLDKISLDDIKPSSRKYPYIAWKTERHLGKDVLFVDGVSKTIDGVLLFDDVRFTLARGEKMVVTGSDLAVAAFIGVLTGSVEPDAGTVKWGSSVNLGVLPRDHNAFFDTDKNLVDWMRQFSTNQDEGFVRGFLGRMLFSGEESQKPARVLSGGEKMRCMIARAMLQDPNALVLDGPTNHLDLESITSFNQSLEQFPGSLILASHDVQFVDTLVTRVLELDGSRYFDVSTRYEEYLTSPERLARLGRG